MILTIWRHGQAGWAASDWRRELTDRGIDDIGFACPQYHAACEARQLPHPDVILHSPWLRTAQTAGILASAFTHATLRSHQALQPGSRPAQVDELLECLLGGAESPYHLVLVSHQPLVSQLVERYLGEPGLVPALSPGGLATLELDMVGPGVARLLFWAMPPEYETSI